MKSAMKIMIVLGAALVLFGIVASCAQKGRSEEKNESEERRKEIRVKLGKPFTVWTHNVRNVRDTKVTQFSATFKNISFSSVERAGSTSFPITIKPSLGKEFLKVAFTAKNLGPRKGFFEVNLCEAKLDNGDIYETSRIVSEGGSGFFKETIEQGKTISGSIWFEIPRGRKPNEITGVIGEVGIGGYVYSTTPRFYLRLK